MSAIEKRLQALEAASASGQYEPIVLIVVRAGDTSHPDAVLIGQAEEKSKRERRPAIVERADFGAGPWVLWGPDNGHN